MQIRRTPRLIRLASSTRGPDCLTELLMEFIALDHVAMPSDELEDWVSTVALCLAAFKRNHRPQVPTAICPLHWLNTVTNRMARAFPGLPRHLIRRTIEAKVLEYWEP